MSIKLHKIMRFMPLLNFFTAIYSMRFFASKKLSAMNRFKLSASVVISWLLIYIPWFMISATVESEIINNIVLAVTMWGCLLALNSIAIYIREMFLSGEEKENVGEIDDNKSARKLQIQKRIVFLPIANILPIFFWLALSQKKGTPRKEMIISAIKILVPAALITIARIIAVELIFNNQDLNNLLVPVTVYLIFVIAAVVSVCEQSKILKFDYTNSETKRKTN